MDNDVFVSAITGWEIADKRAKGHIAALTWKRQS